MSEVVGEQRRGPALWITMNRPDKLNALSGELVEGLRASFRRAAADDEVKVVVLTGAGRAFSAGFDISEEVGSEIAGADRWHWSCGRCRVRPSQRCAAGASREPASSPWPAT